MPSLRADPLGEPPAFVTSRPPDVFDGLADAFDGPVDAPTDLLCTAGRR